MFWTIKKGINTIRFMSSEINATQIYHFSVNFWIVTPSRAVWRCRLRSPGARHPTLSVVNRSRSHVHVVQCRFTEFSLSKWSVPVGASKRFFDFREIGSGRPRQHYTPIPPPRELLRPLWSEQQPTTLDGPKVAIMIFQDFRKSVIRITFGPSKVVGCCSLHSCSLESTRC